MLERERRNGHILTATMRSERLPEQSILIRNLSHRGIGARTLGAPPIEGEEVMLQLDGRAIVGRIRWVRGIRGPLGPSLSTSEPLTPLENLMPAAPHVEPTPEVEFKEIEEEGEGWQ